MLTEQQLPQDVTALAWSGGKVVAGLADGRVVALTAWEQHPSREGQAGREPPWGSERATPREGSGRERAATPSGDGSGRKAGQWGGP